MSELLDKLNIMVLSGKSDKVGSESSLNYDAGTDTIRIICTTFHQAKGLEYGTVVIPFKRSRQQDRLHLNCHKGKVGLAFTVTDNENGQSFRTFMNGAYQDYYLDRNFSDIRDNFPDLHPNEVFEEARILYVAITRAMNRLIILRSQGEYVSCRRVEPYRCRKIYARRLA